MGDPDPVADSARTLSASIAAGEALIGVRAQSGGFITGRAAAESQAPWNWLAAQAAIVGPGVRRLENTVRSELELGPVHRGGSDRNTAESIRATQRLAGGLHPEQREWVARQFDRLAEPGRELELVPTWLPIIIDGIPEVACPWCQGTHLRASQVDGLVACFHPRCPGRRGGQRPAAKIKRDRRGRVRWEWPDGTVQPSYER